jgi:hypothetical protein
LVNEPTQRLAVLSIAASGPPAGPRIASSLQRLRTEKFPVSSIDLGMEARALSDDDMATFVRWIDSLDRL